MDEVSVAHVVVSGIVAVGFTCYNIENLKAMCNELKNGKSEEGAPNFQDDLSNVVSTMTVAYALVNLVNVQSRNAIDRAKLMKHMGLAGGAHLLLKYGFKNKNIRLRETMATLLLGLFVAEKIEFVAEKIESWQSA